MTAATAEAIRPQSEFKILEFPSVKQEEVFLEPGDIVIIRKYLDEYDIYADRHMVGKWRESSPNIHLISCSRLIPRAVLNELIRLEVAQVIKKRRIR